MLMPESCRGTWFEDQCQELSRIRETERLILAEIDNGPQGERSDAVFEELRISRDRMSPLVQLEEVAERGLFARLVSFQRDLASANCTVEFTPFNQEPNKEGSAERRVVSGSSNDFSGALTNAFKLMLNSIGIESGFSILERKSTGDGIVTTTSVTIGVGEQTFSGISTVSCIFRSSFFATALAFDKLVAVHAALFASA